ncbi:sensor histidine kinase [Haloarcula halophila]|uniref:sensor histidine kinase n=1 Tax=Haloarcula TaxID=2237 RepID=UPI0023E42A0C|nr:ATP-binding protein [Halomicroarcula sp. DFY41]
MTGPDGGQDQEAPSSATAVVDPVVPEAVRRSYAAKFTLSLVVVILLVALVGTASYLQVRDTSQATATENLQSSAQLRAEAVDEWHSNMRTQARAFSVSGVYENGTTAQIDTYIERVPAPTAERQVQLHYVDTSGPSDVIAASTVDRFEGQSTRMIDTTLADTVRRAQSADDPDAVVLSNTSYRTRDDPEMAFASPVTGGDGVLVVVSVFSDDLPSFDDQRAAFTTTIIDDSGSPVLGPGLAASEYDPGPGLPDGSGTRPSTAQTADRVYAYAPIDGVDWIAVTTVERSELFRASRTIRHSIVVVIFTSVVSLSAVAVVLGRQTVTPLVTLRQRIEAMEAGTLDVDLSTARTDEIGRLYTAFGNMRDALRGQIREAREAREEAEQSRQEMERQNDRLDQFASTLSHDLRNPLAVARGHVELLSARLDGFDDDSDDPAELLEHVDTIEDAHDRIDSIIQDVLTLTREGESVEETAPVELEQVAREAWANIDSKDATLSVTGTRTFEADRTRLLRAFENLFRNAIDHVGPAVSVEVRLTAGGFSVVDDGPGIPGEAVDDLFEYGRTTSDEGTGIGLSIVKTIAEAHGWRLYVDTTYEDGAMFVFDDVFDEDDPDWYDSEFEWVELAADD